MDGAGGGRLPDFGRTALGGGCDVSPEVESCGVSSGAASSSTGIKSGVVLFLLVRDVDATTSAFRGGTLAWSTSEGEDSVGLLPVGSMGSDLGLTCSEGVVGDAIDAPVGESAA